MAKQSVKKSGVYRYAGPPGGVPGLPAQVSGEQAEQMGEEVVGILKECLESGLYEEVKSVDKEA